MDRRLPRLHQGRRWRAALLHAGDRLHAWRAGVPRPQGTLTSVTAELAGVDEAGLEIQDARVIRAGPIASIAVPHEGVAFSP